MAYLWSKVLYSTLYQTEHLKKTSKSFVPCIYKQAKPPEMAQLVIIHSLRYTIKSI